MLFMYLMYHVWSPKCDTRYIDEFSTRLLIKDFDKNFSVLPTLSLEQKHLCVCSANKDIIQILKNDVGRHFLAFFSLMHKISLRFSSLAS